MIFPVLSVRSSPCLPHHRHFRCLQRSISSGGSNSTAGANLFTRAWVTSSAALMNPAPRAATLLLDIATENRRKFALIHFAGSSECKVDVFLPGQYSMQDKLNAAETFLGGGTDFKRPLSEAIQLMDTGFENADIVFLTDGLCELPEDYLETLRKEQAARKFTVTGILLDAGTPGMDFSLTPFCQKIYRTSELAGDEIVRGLVTQRM